MHQRLWPGDNDLHRHARRLHALRHFVQQQIQRQDGERVLGFGAGRKVFHDPAAACGLGGEQAYILAEIGIVAQFLFQAMRDQADRTQRPT